MKELNELDYETKSWKKYNFSKLSIILIEIHIQEFY